MVNLKDVIIISNRLPITVILKDGAIEYKSSSGGLATGLKFLIDNGARWIGWPGLPSDLLSLDQVKEITRELKTKGCIPVFLTEKQIDYYYNGYCNKILWPLFHGMDVYETDKELVRTYRDVYGEVNEVFAKVVKGQCRNGEYLWVHDYHLMLLPKILRNKGVETNKIGFFLHIPFPDLNMINDTYELDRLLDGLGGADLVGCHTKGYCCNLVKAYQSSGMGSVVSHNVIEVNNHPISVSDFPIGIDYKKFKNKSESPEVNKRADSLMAKYVNQKIILTIDRLDPTKAICNRVEAFGIFLRKYPQYKEHLVMRIVAVPSRTELSEYVKTKYDLENTILGINKQYGNKSWMPIDYTYGSISFTDLVALYKTADVAFIVPLIDGMNLVSKEYIACKNSSGVLILSKTAGAAQQLTDAFIVNPSSKDDMIIALWHAMNISKEAKKINMDRMRACVLENDATWWSSEFLRILESA